MLPLIKAFVYSNILAIGSLLIVAFFWREPLFLTMLMLVLALLFLLVRKNWRDTLLFIFASVAGALAEAFAIAFGAWDYGFSNVAGIPYWLPILWGVAALFIRTVSDEIDAFLKHETTRKKRQ